MLDYRVDTRQLTKMADITLQTVNDALVALTKEVKTLSKLVRKVRATQEDPTGEKAKARAENNGFNRPLDISEELRQFLGLDAGVQISRSAVTRKINTYINENNLKHPDNGRCIILDDKLNALLKPPEGVQIQFLNIQKYLSPHYIKKEKEDKPEPKKADAEPKKRPTVRKTKA